MRSLLFLTLSHSPYFRYREFWVMGRKKAKPNYRRIVLRLPDLDLGTVPLLTAVLTFGVGTCRLRIGAVGPWNLS